MGKDSPKQPDPGALMGQQSALNRLNTTTPFGNITYTGSQNIRVPGGPDLKNQPTGMRVDLSPQQQQLLNQQQQAQATLAQHGIGLANQFPTLQSPYFSSTFQGPQEQFSSQWGAGGQGAFTPTIGGPQAAFAPGDFEASRQAAERAVFDRGMSLLRPEFEREDERLQQRLANQGLPQASRAYTSEMESAGRGRGEQMDRLAQSAVLQGLQAQQQGFGQQLAGYQTEAGRRAQQFGQDITGYQTEAARRAQQYQQDLGGWQTEQARRAQQFGQDLSGFQANQARRAGQLQEILGLFGLQNVQLPQAQNMPQIDVPYQQQQQGSAGLMPGLLALGGAGLGAAYGGLPGAQFGFQAGAGLPGLFGY